MSANFIRDYHLDALKSFRAYKKLAERAIEQIDDDQFFRTIDNESNSIAIIFKHIAGNLHSRWRDFLTTDGEKPDRDRDSEFMLSDETRESLVTFWDNGWQILFANIESLTEEDFSRTVTIRGEKHSIVEAMNRQLTHYSYHVGQIVFLAKHLKSSEWQTLSVPRGKSDAFNRVLTSQTELSEKADGRFEIDRIIEKL